MEQMTIDDAVKFLRKAVEGYHILTIDMSIDNGLTGMLDDINSPMSYMETGGRTIRLTLEAQHE